MSAISKIKHLVSFLLHGETKPTIANISYFSILLLIYLNYKNVINLEFLNVIIEYLKLRDYILLYLILIIMSYVVSLKFAKKLFKNSAITTLNEEV